MGFVDGIGGLLDPGNIAKGIVDAVLPEQLDVVADLAGAAASYYTGNPLGAVRHLAQAMTDLPQAFAQPGGTARPAGGAWRERGSIGFEPNPPPKRGGDTGGFSLEKLMSLLQSILDAVGGKKTTGTGASSSSTGTTKGTKTDDADDSGGGSTTSGTKKTSSSTSKDDTALDKLNKLSDAEFMAKIRKGDLPKEITDDPKAMLAIQQRVNHISEMTKMMTAMMQALHDMQMSILQNVRV
jgi:hypothetical protein